MFIRDLKVILEAFPAEKQVKYALGKRAFSLTEQKLEIITAFSHFVL